MGILENIFGQKILPWFLPLILGIGMFFWPPSPVNSKIIGGFAIVISLSTIVYELKLRLMIKFPSKKPEKLRSNEEQFIANYFDAKKIKYIYEKKIKLDSEIPNKPDFYLPEFDVYVEYLGRWNENFEKRKEYRHRKDLFLKGGYNLIEIYPDNIRDKKQINLNIHQLDWVFTKRLLDLLKKDRS